jgi:hypothetical protein
MEILLSAGLMVFAFIAVLAIFAGASAFFGAIFMLLWNYVMVSAFGLPELSFWQAWALWFLLTLIFRRQRARNRSSNNKD